jgi:hypothetical protein
METLDKVWWVAVLCLLAFALCLVVYERRQIIDICKPKCDTYLIDMRLSNVDRCVCNTTRQVR